MDNTGAIGRLAFKFLQCNMTKLRQLTAVRHDNNRFQRCSVGGTLWIVPDSPCFNG